MAMTDDNFESDKPDAPYIAKRISPAVRAAKIAVVWAVPLSLIVLFIQTASPLDSWVKLTWLPVLTVVWAIWYSRKLFALSEVRVLNTVKTRIKPANTLRKLSYASILAAVGCLLIGYSQRNSEVTSYYPYYLALAIFTGYIIVLVVPQYTEAFTPAAKEEYARLQQEKQSAMLRKDLLSRNRSTKLDDLVGVLWTRWYVRYIFGALLFWAAAELCATSNTNDWPAPALLVLSALACMKEVALWAIGLAVCGAIAWATIGALAAIPVGAAIIIGALIIADSRNR